MAKCDHIDLYYTRDSAECRAVIMTGKRLGINLNLIEVSEADEEQNPELRKQLNVFQTLPKINDNGFVLWESRAIMQYLINKYFPNDALYPNDLQKRATVNRLMFFDIGTLRKALRDYKDRIDKTGKPDEIVEGRLWDKLKLLNSFLSDNIYVAGNCLTLADISIFATVGDVKSTNYDLSQFRNLNNWFERVKQEIECKNFNFS